MNGDHEHRVARVEHVVEHDEAAWAEGGRREIEVSGQGWAGVLAVDVKEAHAAAKPHDDFLRAEVGAVGLPGDAAIWLDTVGPAVLFETVEHGRRRPVETDDAERAFSWSECVGERNEEAPLERADLRDVA